MYEISPAMQKMAEIESALGAGSLGPDALRPDPISAGAAKGVDAAKTSLSLTPIVRPQRTSPFGRMLATTGANMRTPQPGTGTAGMLQSLAQAMGPGMQAYYGAQDAEAALAMQEQEMMHKQIQQQQEQARRQQEHQDEMAYKRAHLAEVRRAHDLQFGNPEELREKDKELKKSLGDGFEYIEKYPPNSRYRMKIKDDIDKWTDKANNSAQAIGAIQGMRRIFKEHPDLWGKVDVALLKRHENDPGIISHLATRAAIPKKDLAAFQELATYTKELLVANTKDVSAKGLNVFMERRMSAAIPGLDAVPAAADKMLDHLESPHAFNYDVGSKKQEYASQGIHWQTPIKGAHKITKAFNMPEESPQPVDQSAQGAAPVGANPEVIQSIRQQYPGFEQFSDEQVAAWAKTRGLM